MNAVCVVTLGMGFSVVSIAADGSVMKSVNRPMGASPPLDSGLAGPCMFDSENSIVCKPKFVSRFCLPRGEGVKPGDVCHVSEATCAQVAPNKVKCSYEVTQRPRR